MKRTALAGSPSLCVLRVAPQPAQFGLNLESPPVQPGHTIARLSVGALSSVQILNIAAFPGLLQLVKRIGQREGSEANLLIHVSELHFKVADFLVSYFLCRTVGVVACWVIPYIGQALLQQIKDVDPLLLQLFRQRVSQSLQHEFVLDGLHRGSQASNDLRGQRTTVCGRSLLERGLEFLGHAQIHLRICSCHLRIIAARCLRMLKHGAIFSMKHGA